MHHLLLGRQPAGLKPELFFLSQNQISNPPVCDVELRVPADIATPQNRFASPPVQREDPLLAIRILEVANVTVLGTAIDDGRITARSGVVISDLQQWVKH